MTKPVIVTRAGKGSALTFVEGDANFTNLQNATITVAADSGTSQTLDLNDTLTIAGGTNLNSVASATDTITVNLDTTVTGLTSLTSTTVVAGTLTTSGATDLLLHTNANTNSGVITIQDGVDGDITVVPNGTGKVHFETSQTRVGINNTNAKITTKGTGDLTLDTNSGTNSGSIVILDGVNGNITITPNGTGSIVLDGQNWPQADGTANFLLKTNGSGQLSYTDTIDGTNKIGYRVLPAVGTKTSSYTLAVGDVGEYVQVGSGGSIIIPNATFAEGDVVVIANNHTAAITITCSITDAYIGGTDTDKATVSLATRGVCNILFLSGTRCIITGNVS
jgi:hypothetical protein